MPDEDKELEEYLSQFRLTGAGTAARDRILTRTQAAILEAEVKTTRVEFRRWSWMRTCAAASLFLCILCSSMEQRWTSEALGAAAGNGRQQATTHTMSSVKDLLLEPELREMIRPEPVAFFGRSRVESRPELSGIRRRFRMIQSMMSEEEKL